MEVFSFVSRFGLCAGWKISLALCPIPLLYALIYLPISQRHPNCYSCFKRYCLPFKFTPENYSLTWGSVPSEKRLYLTLHDWAVSLHQTPWVWTRIFIIFRQQVFLAFLHIPGMSKHCWPSKIPENTLELWTFYLTFCFIHCTKKRGNINRRWREEVKRKNKCGSEGCLDHHESWTHDLVNETEQNQRYTVLLRSQGTRWGNTEQVRKQSTVYCGQGDKPALIRKTRGPWQEFMMT